MSVLPCQLPSTENQPNFIYSTSYISVNSLPFIPIPRATSLVQKHSPLPEFLQSPYWRHHLLPLDSFPLKFFFHVATRLISKVHINDVLLTASRIKFRFLDFACKALPILSLVYFSDRSGKKEKKQIAKIKNKKEDITTEATDIDKVIGDNVNKCMPINLKMWIRY